MPAETDLVQQLKKKDIAAYRSLYDAYAPALFGLILKLAPDPRVATVILERSFMSIWSAIGTLDPAKEKLFHWMTRITIRQCTEVLKLPEPVIRHDLGLKCASPEGR